MNYVDKYCQEHNLTVEEFWKRAKEKDGLYDVLHTYGCPPGWHASTEDCITWWTWHRSCEECWKRTVK